MIAKIDGFVDVRVLIHLARQAMHQVIHVAERSCLQLGAVDGDRLVLQGLEMKLETAQLSCECMPEPQTVRGAASVNQDFRLFVAFDRFVPVCHQRSSPAAQQSGHWTSSPKAALYPEGVPTKG
ncbi:hypothetical protein [Mesorhizobium sp.]|uniref:hypothetical protein n=1 Tax=Mesorhizobium sp. TaxID=1871066 RepID=UPI0025DB319D|nr:hypothetical protein [Mesorhizobium sp.]